MKPAQFNKRFERIKEVVEEPPKKKKREINHGYEALGEEIRDHFKVKTSKFWWLFWKVPEWKIRQAFKECQEKGLGIDSLIKFSKSIK